MLWLDEGKGKEKRKNNENLNIILGDCGKSMGWISEQAWDEIENEMKQK